MKLFSDSEIVLSSINSAKTCVHNQEAPFSFRVYGHENPASLASRGCSPEQFLQEADSRIWLHGFSMLSDTVDLLSSLFKRSKLIESVPEV